MMLTIAPNTGGDEPPRRGHVARSPPQAVVTHRVIDHTVRGEDNTPSPDAYTGVVVVVCFFPSAHTAKRGRCFDIAQRSHYISFRHTLRDFEMGGALELEGLRDLMGTTSGRSVRVCACENSRRASDGRRGVRGCRRGCGLHMICVRRLLGGNRGRGGGRGAQHAQCTRMLQGILSCLIGALSAESARGEAALYWTAEGVRGHGVLWTQVPERIIYRRWMPVPEEEAAQGRRSRSCGRKHERRLRGEEIVGFQRSLSHLLLKL